MLMRNAANVKPSEEKYNTHWDIAIRSREFLSNCPFSMRIEMPTAARG